jgi:hypothetical protein
MHYFIHQSGTTFLLFYNILKIKLLPLNKKLYLKAIFDLNFLLKINIHPLLLLLFSANWIEP